MPFFSVLFFSLCAIGSLVQPSRGLSVTNVFTPLPDVAERPTPIILLPGEGLGPDVFHLWVESLQSKGYGGVVTTLASTDDPEALGSAINDIVESEHMVPPVLVAHSIGSYAAINYLESHSLAGLVLLNPIPVHPSQAASMLSSKHADCVATSYQTETEDSEEGIMSRYYGLRPPNVIPSHFFCSRRFPDVFSAKPVQTRRCQVGARGRALFGDLKRGRQCTLRLSSRERYARFVAGPCEATRECRSNGSRLRGHIFYF